VRGPDAEDVPRHPFPYVHASSLLSRCASVSERDGSPKPGRRDTVADKS
jgi:hypothetical protein